MKKICRLSVVTLVAFATAAQSAEEMKQPTEKKIRGASSENLGTDYLFAAGHIEALGLAKKGRRVKFSVDGKTVIADTASADFYIQGFQKRLDAYRAEIVRRGFEKVESSYWVKDGRDCMMSGGDSVSVQQDGCDIRLTIRPIPGQEVTHAGVVVENRVIMQNSLFPGLNYVGKVEKGKLKISSPCMAELIGR